MKKIIQLVLIILLIIVSLIFYNEYFKDNKKNAKKLESTAPKDQIFDENQNNLIKNLKYDIKIDDGKQYILTADLSEITYENIPEQENIEIVNMQVVNGIFVDESNIPITINSDYAVYNSYTYNTFFYDNVKVKYLDNIILSDKLDINFNDDIVYIYENVIYEGLQGNIETDNVKINLITRNVEMFMNNKLKKVKILSTR